MKTWEEISNIMAARRAEDSTLVSAMKDIRDRYHSDTVVVLTDVKDEPSLPAPGPFLVADAIDHTAMRAASVMPGVWCPAIDQASDKSKQRATTRGRAMRANWHFSQLNIMLRRAFRQLVGYGTFAMLVVPDFEFNRARIELRDPLGAYPSLRSPEEIREPIDCGFVYGRSAEWILRRYPEARDLLMKNAPRQRHFIDGQRLWDMVEWIDENSVVIGILGPRDFAYGSQAKDSDVLGGSYGVELRRWPNRAGVVPVACPRRVTLDRIEGQVAKITGIMDLIGKLWALDVVAAEKAIFPDMVALGEEGRAPELISGSWKDGRTGELNLVTRARQIQNLQSAPGPLTHPVLDRLEAHARGASGALPLYEGETSGSLRTGQAIHSIGGFAIDPRIQELHEVMQAGLEPINRGIAEVERGYWPSKKYVVFTGLPNDQEPVIYTPSKDYERGSSGVDNLVNYPFPGADIYQLTVGISQLVGTELMPKQMGREMHPLIPNAEVATTMVTEERIEDAALTGVLQKVMDGTMPLIDAAILLKKFKADKEIVDAIIYADEQARKRQATQPADELDPAMMPGLAAVGQGAEAMVPPASIPPPPAGSQNLKQLINALRAGR